MTATTKGRTARAIRKRVRQHLHRDPTPTDGPCQHLTPALILQQYRQNLAAITNGVHKDGTPCQHPIKTDTDQFINAVIDGASLPPKSLPDSDTYLLPPSVETFFIKVLTKSYDPNEDPCEDTSPRQIIANLRDQIIQAAHHQHENCNHPTWKICLSISADIKTGINRAFDNLDKTARQRSRFQAR